MDCVSQSAVGRAFLNRSLFLLSVFLFALSSAEAATVRGRLIHVNNNFAQGVAVRLNSDIYGPSGFAYSGADGMYFLNGIPPGNYTLEIWLNDETVLRYAITVGEPMTDFPPVRLPF